MLGSYEVDDEGVKASRVSLIEKGQLVNYLLGRQPIRDFPHSNGHGRASVTGPPTVKSGKSDRAGLRSGRAPTNSRRN